MRFNPFKWLQKEEKASATGYIVSGYNVGQPVWTPDDYEELARESYVRNAIAYACVKMIAQSAARLPVLLMRGEDQIEEHPALGLIRMPNPANSGPFFFESVYAFLLIQGNSYIEAVGPKSKMSPPKELWCLRPDRVKVIPGKQGLPQAYEYESSGLTKRFAVDPLTGRGEVLHIKEFNPLNDWYGLGRVRPAAYSVDRHNAAGAHNTALLQNGARPSGALVFKPVKSADGGETAAPAAVVKAAHEKLLERYSGAENAGKPMVLGAHADWLEMGLSPKDMDFAESKLDAARDICASFGVPIELLLPGQSTYNNKAEARYAFFDQTVIPLASHVLSEVGSWMLPRFGDGYRFEIDEDMVPALEPRREIRRQSTIDLFDRGIIDIDEARERLQYGPRPTQAVSKVDAGVLKSLVEALDKTGPEPLHRYAMSVGLYPPGTTPEAVARAILDSMGDDDEFDAPIEGAEDD